MEINWPCLNKKFIKMEMFWQYQVDKYVGLTELEEDHLAFGLRLGMYYIPKILKILDEYEYKEDTCYSCLELVDRLSDGLKFTSEVVFGKIDNSKMRYLDSIGGFVTRNDLKPINYAINRQFMKNKFFRLESLAKRVGCTPTVKKAKLIC